MPSVVTTAGLVLELDKRGAQRRFDVFLAGAGAEVHQQLAHIRIALAHAHIQLAEAAVAFGLSPRATASRSSWVWI